MGFLPIPEIRFSLFSKILISLITGTLSQYGKHKKYPVYFIKYYIIIELLPLNQHQVVSLKEDMLFARTQKLG